MLRRKTYAAVAQVLATGSEAEAASRLHVTRQAVSHHVREAEKQIPPLRFALDVSRRLHLEHADFFRDPLPKPAGPDAGATIS